MRYNVEYSKLKDLLLEEGNLQSKKDIDANIQILDESLNRIRDSERYIETHQKYLGKNLTIEDGCTTDNVLECITTHCGDAGPILCTGCVLSKKCLTALTALCAIDVIFEIENPLYCDEVDV